MFFLLVVHFKAFPKLLFSGSLNVSQTSSVRRWSCCRARAAGTRGESKDKKLRITTRRMRRWNERWQRLSIIAKTMKTMMMVGTLPHKQILLHDKVYREVACTLAQKNFKKNIFKKKISKKKFQKKISKKKSKKKFSKKKLKKKN